MGYVIHKAPGPMMCIQPTVEMAKRNSKQRIDPLIEESEVLSDLVSDPRSRDSGNTVLAKEFPGGLLVMTGANSAVGLRSMAARYLFLDEIDAYPGDVDGEGDPIQLALARTRTFSRHAVYICEHCQAPIEDFQKQLMLERASGGRERRATDAWRASTCRACIARSAGLFGEMRLSCSKRRAKILRSFRFS